MYAKSDGNILERSRISLSEDLALTILSHGEVVGWYRIASGSNYTFLVQLDAGPGQYILAIYKPRDGERPLWDFPRGSLYKREYAAFLMSEELGWPRVPLTVVRDGPFGVGSMQLYSDSDHGKSYFDLIETRKADFACFAVFDVLANNADRKAGHCLLGQDGVIWSIDHGVTFHREFKLRTVMLEFWGEAISPSLVGDMRNLYNSLKTQSEFAFNIGEVISPTEIEALIERLDVLISEPVIPVLDSRVNLPWPLV